MDALKIALSDLEQKEELGADKAACSECGGGLGQHATNCNLGSGD